MRARCWASWCWCLSLVLSRRPGPGERLVGLDARLADRLHVLGHVGAHQFGKALRRAANRLVLAIEQLVAQVRGQDLVHLGVEARDHRRGELGGPHETEPHVHFIARETGLRDRRVLGCERRALGPCGDEGAQLAGLHLRQEVRIGADKHRHGA